MFHLVAVVVVAVISLPVKTMELVVIRVFLNVLNLNLIIIILHVIRHVLLIR